MIIIGAGILNQVLGLLWFVIVIYTLYVLITSKKPKNLNKLIWALLIIFIPLLGVILYWVIEKKILK